MIPAQVIAQQLLTNIIEKSEKSGRLARSSYMRQITALHAKDKDMHNDDEWERFLAHFNQMLVLLYSRGASAHTALDIIQNLAVKLSAVRRGKRRGFRQPNGERLPTGDYTRYVIGAVGKELITYRRRRKLATLEHETVKQEKMDQEDSDFIERICEIIEQVSAEIESDFPESIVVEAKSHQFWPEFLLYCAAIRASQRKAVWHRSAEYRSEHRDRVVVLIARHHEVAYDDILTGLLQINAILKA